MDGTLVVVRVCSALSQGDDVVDLHRTELAAHMADVAVSEKDALVVALLLPAVRDVLLAG